MDKILVFIEDKEVERKIIRELSNDYFFNQTYIDEFNYISIINQHKPQIIYFIS